jgi:hypothetical protein
MQLGPLSASLNIAELAYDEFVARRRMEDVRRYARRNVAALATGDNEDENHLIGAHGEHAFAKWLGTVRRADRRYGICSSCYCYIGTVNTFKIGGDVGSYQVRTRRHSSARLIVRELDRDNDIFVLVLPLDASGRDHALVSHPNWRMSGWIRGEDAKRFEWRDDPRERGAAYFVPQSALNLMLTLPMEETADEPEREPKQFRRQEGTGIRPAEKPTRQG